MNASRFKLIGQLVNDSRYFRKLHRLTPLGLKNNCSTPCEKENMTTLCFQQNELINHYCTKQQFHSSASTFSSDSDDKHLRATEISEADYEAWAEETLDSLSEYFEDFPETEQCNDDYDCAYGNGVLTLHLGSTEGTYVLNKQTPNKQIWLSSPLSGPKRFDYYQGQWVYLRDGTGLHKLLEEEISEGTGLKIDLKKCKFYTYGVAERLAKSN
ncbi:unnamed protein product [Lymnaea stagnalis]|uniref:ferroxidase n=1 Tax=Lymnaea stagnalis TaxID=6523 RepID=A0AAV2HM25_LYMST